MPDDVYGSGSYPAGHPIYGVGQGVQPGDMAAALAAYTKTTDMVATFAKLTDIPVSKFLPNTLTIDTLPDPAANLGKYALVSDLFGDKTDTVLASAVGANAFWQPVRQSYSKTVPIAADMILRPLKSPSSIFLTGTIATGITRNISLSGETAWPGATFEIRNDMSGLGALKVAGLAVGGLLSVIFGTQQRFFYELGTGWKQFS